MKKSEMEKLIFLCSETWFKPFFKKQLCWFEQLFSTLKDQNGVNVSEKPSNKLSVFLGFLERCFLKM